MKLPSLRIFSSSRTLTHWTSWLRIARPGSNETVLDRRHVYILPTRQGILFSVILISMLIGSINYSLGLGFILTFLLAGLGVVAMLHTWHNLAHLVISPGRTAPVTAGEDATIRLVALDRAGRERLAIGIQQGKTGPIHADIPANDRGELALPVPTRQRGWLSTGRITISTEFPLGLFHAWSYVELDHCCLVYPRPAAPGQPLPTSGADGASSHQYSNAGDDDFYGLRTYQRGDSLRQIDWKASAREQGLLTKQFKGGSSTFRWLDWQATPGRDPEQRIAQLARWVRDAHESGQPYGLRMPGKEISPARGDAHTHSCMETLALFEVPH